MTASWDDEIRELQRQADFDSKSWFPALHRRTKAHRLLHMALGLGEEAGEVQGVIKKWNRRSKPELANLDRAALGAECADVLIYLLHVCEIAEIDLSREYWKKREINQKRFGPQA